MMRKTPLAKNTVLAAPMSLRWPSRTVNYQPRKLAKLVDYLTLSEESSKQRNHPAQLPIPQPSANFRLVRNRQDDAPLIRHAPPHER